MFNVSDSLEIKGIEKTGCTRGHIIHCISDKNAHEIPKDTYFGSTVRKGSMVLHTKNGDFTLHYDEKNGWARALSIE